MDLETQNVTQEAVHVANSSTELAHLFTVQRIQLLDALDVPSSVPPTNPYEVTPSSAHTHRHTTRIHTRFSTGISAEGQRSHTDPRRQLHNITQVFSANNTSSFSHK